MQELLLETIRTDGGTQSRETIDKQYVADLAEVIKGGGKRLPPIEVYGDGTEVWCAEIAAANSASAARAGSSIPAVSSSSNTSVG